MGFNQVLHMISENGIINNRCLILYYTFCRFEQQMASVAPPPSTVPPQSSDKPLPGSNTKSSPIIDPSKGFESTDGSTPEESSSTKGKKMVSKLSGFMSKTKESPQQKKQMTPKSMTPS